MPTKILFWSAAPQKPEVIVKLFARLFPVSIMKHVHAKTLTKVLGLRQRDHSRHINGLRSLDGSINKLTHYGISRSFPPSQLEPPRFQDVALFTEKQFVRRGLPSRLPALILLLLLISSYWGPCCLSVFLKLLIDMFFCFSAQNNLGPVSLPLCNAFGFREDLLSSFLSQSPRKQAGHTG